MAGRCRGLYARTPAPDVDAQVADADPAGRRREGGQQLARAQPELLGDDRRIGLDVDGEALEPDDPAGARRGRHALGDERLERRDRAGEPELVLEPEGAGRIGDEVADARIGRARGVVMPGRLGRGRRPPPSGVVGADLPGPWRSATQRRVEVVEGRRRDERLRQLRDAPDEVRAPVRIELAEDVVEQEERRAPVERGQEVELGELEGEDRGPLLAARGEPGQIAAGQVEGEVVAMRPDRASSRSRPPSRPSRRAGGRARRGASRRDRPARS